MRWLTHTWLKCYRMKERYRAAIKECHKAMQLDPKLVVPHLIMAQCFAADKSPNLAVEEYKQP